MKFLSYWALLNIRKTIVLLILLHSLLAALSFYLGVRLFAEEVILPRWLFYICLLIFVGIQIAYPLRKTRHHFLKWNYTKQKVMDFLVVATYCVAMTTLTNIGAHQLWKETNPAPMHTRSIVLKPEAHKSIEDSTNKRKPGRKIKKALKKKFRSLLKQAKKQVKSQKKTASKASIIAIMVLAILLVAVLSCFLACSDASWLGLLVFGSLTILILVLGIKWIRKNEAGKTTG